MAAVLALGKFDLAWRIAARKSDLLNSGLLHMMAKRGDISAVKWLLEHGADPNARWAHWDSEVSPLHAAILGDHASMVRLLLTAGTDPTVRDSKHNSDALGWAGFFGRGEIVRILQSKGDLVRAETT